VEKASQKVCGGKLKLDRFWGETGGGDFCHYVKFWGELGEHVFEQKNFLFYKRRRRMKRKKTLD